MQRYCKMILSILVFMLVQGQVVSENELFPISMFDADSGEHQPIEPQKNEEIEPLPGKNVTERCNVGPGIVDDDVRQLKERIVDAYDQFVEDPNTVQWKTLPSFEGEIGTEKWFAAAESAQEFFSANNNHATPWKHLLAKKTPINLLYITAARYLFVIHVLWKKSDRKLIACKEIRDRYSGIIQSFEIPETRVCFPKPYGSATYKSDYDVGLIGQDSATVTERFNEYFQNEFGRPSELVFDTNVYAYTLEFSMPRMFPKLLKANRFVSRLAELEKKAWFQMQELASAYYKVFKYNEEFFAEMKNEAIIQMANKEKAWKCLTKWLERFGGMNEQVDLRRNSYNSQANFRKTHNEKYQEYLENVAKRGQYDPRATGNLAKALLYAAEAYHTRGAIRHVVQGIQMKAIPTCQYHTPLSTYDLWVSMIENWGEANKEYQHCGDISMVECLMKMSKYLSRMFDAMRVIRRSRLPKELRQGLLDFGSTNDPEFTINLLLRYKRSDERLPSAAYYFSGRFLQQFKCKVKQFYWKFPEACLKNIHKAVNAYNSILAANVNEINGLQI